MPAARRSQFLQDDLQSQADRVGQQSLPLGIGAGVGADGGGEVEVERLFSAYRARAEHVQATRLVIVVSHPARFSTSPAPLRLSRSQVSWTASSASDSEPSIR
jgi:hypothetical protein